jgi:hypothetical protein
MGRSFSDEVKQGALFLALCLLGLGFLQPSHFTLGNPTLGFLAAVVIASLSLAAVPPLQPLPRTMQDGDYGRPVDPGTGPDHKRKPRS